MSGEPESCPAPFGGAKVEYPVRFDLRMIYIIAENPDPEPGLRAALAGAGVPCSLIQATAKPGAKYGRIGARIVVDSKARMEALYTAVAALPGMKAVI
ncbi:MAG: hypothetical protein WAZ99_02400 [Rectinemataceae bacterium]